MLSSACLVPVPAPYVLVSVGLPRHPWVNTTYLHCSVLPCYESPFLAVGRVTLVLSRYRTVRRVEDLTWFFVDSTSTRDHAAGAVAVYDHTFVNR